MAKKKVIKTNAMRFLDQHQVPYQHYEVPSKASLDAISVAQLIDKPVEQVFKTLITHDSQGHPYVAVIPAAEHLDLKKLAKVFGVKKLEMLPLQQLLTTTGYVKGGCSPFAMKKHYPTVIHKTALSQQDIIVSAGKIGEQLAIAPQYFAQHLSATFEDVIK